MSLETKNTVKGDLSRVDINAWNYSTYWLPENIAKRKALAEKDAAEKMIEEAKINGWSDIHGGDTGAYWRGINPITGKYEKLPEEFGKRKLTTNQFEKLKKEVEKLHAH